MSRKKPSPSISDVQKDLEQKLLEKFKESREHLVENKTKKIILSPDSTCYVFVDGHFEDDRTIVFVEIYARIGKLQPGHRNKIAKDLLKFQLLQRKSNGKKVECYYIMPEGDGVTELQKENSWLNPCRQEFYGVEFLTFKLSEDDEDKLRKATKRQKR